MYVSTVKDITKPNDEVLVIACCSFLQQNISIITASSMWQYNETTEPQIVVLLNSLNNVLPTLPGM